jgi:hypothetical protein
MKLKFKTAGIAKLQKTLDNLSKLEMTAGIHKGAGMHSEAGVLKAGLLAMHEFSDGEHYPRRPIGQITFDKHSEEWSDKATKAIGRALVHSKNEKVVTQAEFKKALASTANDMRKDMKRSFGRPPLEGNAPATVEMKGFNTPMIETGELKNSITSKVRRK